MNLSKRLRAASRLLYPLYLRARHQLPRKQCLAFSSSVDSSKVGIGPIYVINLDRQPDRWTAVGRELDRILDANGTPLSRQLIRCSACDAQARSWGPLVSSDVDPVYTLGDQLFVEPQPQALPDAFDLQQPIRMSAAEVAVALSHIGVWKTIARSNAPYSLVLEDDVVFARRFSSFVDDAWSEMTAADGDRPEFDLLYLSYKEVRHGAPKQLLSRSLFRPERGLWYMSGYVLSKKGAEALLALLPCRGPVDLWINHQFRSLDVRALRRSVISQRLDLDSTNSYSILPTLSRIGILDGGDALFQWRPRHAPVFAFGAANTGLSSLAMAVSMLGYRCCSDVDQIPKGELGQLLSGGTNRAFDAYVNVGVIGQHLRVLKDKYPRAKFVVIDGVSQDATRETNCVIDELVGADVLRLRQVDASSWRALCEHLRLAPPDAPYPILRDVGQRQLQGAAANVATFRRTRRLRHDPSPWVVEARAGWTGIRANEVDRPEPVSATKVCFNDDLTEIRSARWFVRSDTFPGNLGLFRPANVRPNQRGHVSLTVKKEPLGVRDFSAAAISSRDRFLFGRFEATLQPARVPGLVTGFFLHRDSPRQEIDVEIAGNRPDCLLVNVFYNPGSEGAKFDYGYRGAPVVVSLGFDATRAPHRYAIEWDPCEIRWLVDDALVHRRVMWDPTPIPHLPMTLHANTWPTRSRELAGRLKLTALPASTRLYRIAVDAIADRVSSVDAGADLDRDESSAPGSAGSGPSRVLDPQLRLTRAGRRS